jgi:hypothetical protein
MDIGVVVVWSEGGGVLARAAACLQD